MPGSVIRETPKSAIFGVNPKGEESSAASARRTFSGLMSRWVMPFAWIAVSPSQMEAPIVAASAGGRGP